MMGQLRNENFSIYLVFILLLKGSNHLRIAKDLIRTMVTFFLMETSEKNTRMKIAKELVYR